MALFYIFKVHWILPVVFFVICVMLTIMPVYSSPWEVGMGVAIMLTGVPVYFIFIYLPQQGMQPKRLVKRRWTSEFVVIY
jgi:hypothetical protein